MTALPQWPTTVPYAGSAGVSGGPQPNVISFEPETGPSIDRRRSSSVGSIRDVELPNITNAQYLTFISFFKNVLKDGILPFIWVDPLTSEPRQVKFVQKKPVYQETKLMPDVYRVQFQLYVMRS